MLGPFVCLWEQRVALEGFLGSLVAKRLLDNALLQSLSGEQKLTFPTGGLSSSKAGRPGGTAAHQERPAAGPRGCSGRRLSGSQAVRGRGFPAATRTRLCPLHSDQQRWQTCPVGPSTRVLEDTPSCPWDVFLILPPRCRTDPNGNEYRKNVRGARSEGTLQNGPRKGAQTRSKRARATAITRKRGACPKGEQRAI